MIFRGIFTRTNGSMGSITSEALDLQSAIERTIFDAIYCSPYKAEDITVLRIDDLDKNEVIHSINDEWKNKDLTTILG